VISKSAKKTDLFIRRGDDSRLRESPLPFPRVGGYVLGTYLHIMDHKVQVKFKKVKLAEVRKKLELTQEKVAKHLGMTQADMSRLESGKKTPEWIYKAIRLHELLKEAGYTLDDLAIPPYDENE
jgi:DNA-binding XRE family transcriptional regulator